MQKPASVRKRGEESVDEMMKEFGRRNVYGPLRRYCIPVWRGVGGLNAVFAQLPLSHEVLDAFATSHVAGDGAGEPGSGRAVRCDR